MTTLSGVESAAFVDDDTQTVVRYTRAHEETTVAIRERLETDATDTRGDDYWVGYDSQVDWAEPDLSDVSQMAMWMTDRTDVQFVAVGPQKVIQWYEPHFLRTRQETNVDVGNVDPLHGLMSYQGGDGTDGTGTIVGYPNGSHRIYASRNALHALAYDAEHSILDTAGNGEPDGYDYTDGTLSGEAVSAGVYEAFGPTDGSVAERGVDLLMPIEDQTWTLSAQVQQEHADGDTAIRLAALDKSGSVIGSAEDITQSSGTGRISAEITTPTDTYTLRAVILRINNATAQSAKAQVTEPALRVDGGTSYATR